MNTIKRMLIALGSGLGLGLLLSMWLGPSFITWWYTPPAGVSWGNCGDSVRWATEQFVRFQIGLGVVMGIALATGAEYVAHKRAKKAALAAQSQQQPQVQLKPQ